MKLIHQSRLRITSSLFPQNSSIPHSVCLGNHDREADLSPEQVMALDASLSTQSLSQTGPSNISGSGNYYIDIMDAANRTRRLGDERDEEDGTPAARIWFLDTGESEGSEMNRAHESGWSGGWSGGWNGDWNGDWNDDWNGDWNDDRNGDWNDDRNCD